MAELVREHQSEAIARPTKEERLEDAIRNNQSPVPQGTSLASF